MPHATIDEAMQLAVQHHQAGRLLQAEQMYRQVLAQSPRHARAMHHLGLIAHQAGRDDAAVDLIRRSIALVPDHAEAYYNLGIALEGTGAVDEAIAAYRQAITLKPDFSGAHDNLGNALKAKGQFEEAMAAYRRAIALRPGNADAHNNLGHALEGNGQRDEAIAAYRQSIVLSPQVPLPHFNLALALLAQGHFEHGWEEYEWRWHWKDFPSAPRNFPQPPWDGAALKDRAILLHAEQGFGDTLQFIRYLPMVQGRGGKIILECQPALERLLRTLPGNFQIVTRGQPLPAFDVHCPLVSLPRAFETRLASIPNAVPYLRPHAQDAAKWRSLLAGPSGAAKVGIVWAGSPTHKSDRSRSVDLAMLAPLGQVPGVRLFSLQKGNAAAQVNATRADLEVVDRTEELIDFADTAALIANLDLVIAVDTAVAHLAGAMGKPVWLLLAFVPDWRWLLEREDSPWYPSMRLFRQPSAGDWESVIERVKQDLSCWIEERAAF